MKSGLKLIFPLYFYRYRPAYDALFAETIYCAACARYQEQMLATYNVVPRLHEIACPTLVLVGRYDFICPPSQAQLMHEHIPHSRLVIFEDSGHLPWIEEPQRFTDAVKTWLAQTRP